MKELAEKYLKAAHAESISDIYILPHADNYQLWFRDSKSRTLIDQLKQEQALSLIAHFKFVAGMNVGEKRRSQLGSCLYTFTGEARRLRLSTVGDYIGRESLVIRLLHDQAQTLDFWFDEDLPAVEQLVKERGLYLFSGPVGSGKTSLMYHLARTGFEGQQVITIEDPVEIEESGFLQLQRNDTIGATYDDLIKLALRHMPDLVIVGEIRDELTARAVVRASLTGFTVFSTVHAGSIRGVHARLLELGIGAGELAHSLKGVIYQRLINGKGVIDCAKAGFNEHSAESWNEKIESLALDGHLSGLQADTEKITAL